MERQPEPNFERVRMALAGGRPDRVPLAEVGIDQRLKEAFLGQPIETLSDEVAFWYQAGYDYVLLGRMLGLGLFPGIRYGRPYKPERQEKSTPERVWAQEGQGIITNVEEFEAYPWPEPAQADYSEFEEIHRCLPAGMKAIAYLGPIFQWVWMLMGFESFAFALRDEPDLVERIVHKVGQIRLAVCKHILKACDVLGAVWLLDDIAYSEGLLVSPEFLRKHVFPWFRGIGELCRQRGLPLLYHSDGTFWAVINDLLDVGIQAIHPIEPKGMGADLGRLKGQLGGRLCFIGGIDLDILVRGSPHDVARETRRVLDALAQEGGYLAGSSNTVTEAVPLANYRAMLQTVWEYGKR